MPGTAITLRRKPSSKRSPHAKRKFSSGSGTVRHARASRSTSCRSAPRRRCATARSSGALPSCDPATTSISIARRTRSVRRARRLRAHGARDRRLEARRPNHSRLRQQDAHERSGARVSRRRPATARSDAVTARLWTTPLQSNGYPKSTRPSACPAPPRSNRAIASACSPTIHASCRILSIACGSWKAMRWWRRFRLPRAGASRSGGAPPAILYHEGTKVHESTKQGSYKTHFVNFVILRVFVIIEV